MTVRNVHGLWKRLGNNIWVKSVLFGILPFLLCVLLCASDGKKITDIYLPASAWNDELIYYKQVEATVEYGAPLGYYGYNESHAQISAFATWGPAVLLPWILYGKIFGWGFLSPIICNIIFMCLCFAGFVLLARPDVKQLGALAVMSGFFFPFARYMLSAMPEVYAYGAGILFVGLSVNCYRDFRWYKMWIMLLPVLLLTLVRPYLFLLILFPAALIWRKNRIYEIPVLLTGIVSVGVYFWYTAMFCAPYLSDSMDMMVLKLLTSGHLSGIKQAVLLLWQRLINIGAAAWAGITTRLPRGAFCAVFLLCFVLLAFLLMRGGDQTGKLLSFIVIVEFVGMLAAVVLFYPDLQPAAKHLLVFAAMAIFVLGMYPSRYFLREIIFCIGCLCVFCGDTAEYETFNYDIPYYDIEIAREREYWETIFNAEIEIVGAGGGYYDNTVLWELLDYVDDGVILVDHANLWMLPEGIAINCCTIEHLIGSRDQLQGRYAYVVVGGIADQQFREEGLTEIGRTETAVCYRLR